MSAINLTDLFNTRVFRIPDYQRGYAWEEKQLTELWDDIDEIVLINGELKKHYTGTIYLEETLPIETEKWLSGVKFFNVVDGQQRLTTISILLFELLKATKIGYAEKKKEKLIETFISETNLSGESKVYKFSYSSADKNYTFLLHTIFEDNKIVSSQNHQNHYTKNLLEAKLFFQTRISQLNERQKDLLFRKLTTSLQFDIRTIEKDLDVQAVFETMNNRGKPLSTLEKLKNRLIYLTEKLNNPDEDKKILRRKINDAWGKIYTCLAQNHERILDEDEFLSAHLSLYRKPTESTFSENAAEEKVFQMFCNKPEKHELEDGAKEEPISFRKIETYIIKLSELAPIWYEIHNSSFKLIKRILTLNGSKDIKIFLSSVLNKTKNRREIEETFSNLEKILFRNRVPGIGVMDERTPASWARDIYNGEDHIQGINQKQTDFINTPIVVPNIIQSFNYLFTYERGAKGFHRWSNLKYFLFEYEEFLKNKAREANDKVTIDDFGETTIEHIIPQKFWDNWNDVVQPVVKPLKKEDHIEQVHKVLINSLGNLTILRHGKNSSLGNIGWIDKKERFRTGSYNEIEISKNDSWTKNHIAKRGKEMLKFLETKVSGLKFTNKDIERILFNDDYVIELIYDRI